MTYSHTTILAFDGVEQSIAEHALDYGIPALRIVQRLIAGWTVEQAITRPVTVLQREKRHARSERRDTTARARLYTYRGMTMSIAEWAAYLGTTDNLIRQRLARGWSIGQALKLPPESLRYEHDGLELTLTEWAERTGIRKSTLEKRLHRGVSFAEAITTPVLRRGKRR